MIDLSYLKGQRFGASACRLDGFDGFFQLVHTARGGHHMGARLAQSNRAGLADA